MADILLKMLQFIGRHASGFLASALLLVSLLPGISSLLRPWLPWLVSLVLGLAIARLNARSIVLDYLRPGKVSALFAALILFIPATCLLLVSAGRALGADEDTLLILAVFGASPPLSSAASLALLLGYDARITLQFGLLATLCLPVIGPLTLAMVGIDSNIATLDMTVGIALMIAGGFALGILLPLLLGKSRIADNADAFNGMATLAMIMFLFPLFDGVAGFARQNPQQALSLLVLAMVLNFGGHLLTARLVSRFTNRATASAAGLMFGNRNVSFFLAVLPANPALGLFIAAAQIPVYATPALFGRR